MRYSLAQWGIVILALVLLLAICHAVFGQELSAEDYCRLSESEMLAGSHVTISCVDGVKDVGAEVAKLHKAYPLPWPVSIVCLKPDMSGWAVPPQGKVAFIYIRPAGADERVKVLRHEWQHLLQVANKRPHMGEEAETEARKAEQDGVLRK
jgi:hypothetical protein